MSISVAVAVSVAEVAELEKPNKNGKERIAQKTCRVNIIKPPLFSLNFPYQSSERD